MTAGLTRLLDAWFDDRDAHRWVLGTVFETHGPCYRKAGAMMLVNDVGEQFGLLSGGCLEADIQRHANRLMLSGGARTVCYDGSDEGDVAYQLGLGCGGIAHILLQCVEAANDYLGLEAVRRLLLEGKRGHLVLDVPRARGPARGRVWSGSSMPLLLGRPVSTQAGRGLTCLLAANQGRTFVAEFVPEPSILVVGGGVDARPLVRIADELDWHVTVCDPRPAFARPRHFPDNTRILKEQPCALADTPLLASLDAAIVMSHSVDIDSAALCVLQRAPLRYLGLLGPTSRRARVLKRSGLDAESFACEVTGPAGLDLGGDLPAAVAISILAQCHAAIYERRSLPLARGLVPPDSGLITR